MLFRLPLIVALAFTAQVGMAQSVQWSLGTDPVRWASGFQNVQCGMQLHPEWGVVAGFGRMNGMREVRAVCFNPVLLTMTWPGQAT